MNTIIYILIATIILLIISFVIILIYIINKNKPQESEENMLMVADAIKTIKEEIRTDIRETRRELDSKIAIGQKDMKEDMKYQTTHSQNMIKEIYEHLNKVNQSVIEVKEGSKQVVSMTEQLTNLEKVLTNQKQRGNWGESSLELILSNFLPRGVYEMQYKYKNESIVDAIIKIKEKILPIDSKFSIDNYRRCVDSQNEEDKKYFAEEFKKDIKKRIEETAKYIIETGEDTLPFAFMFIPSEAIYYDINAGNNGNLKIDTDKLLAFAQERKVIIVSPTSILAYLHLVISGVKDSQVEKNIEDIKKKIQELGSHLQKYDDYMNKLGNTLSTTVNHYNSASKEFKKIDKDIYKITDGETGGAINVLLIEKPDKEE